VHLDAVALADRIADALNAAAIERPPDAYPRHTHTGEPCQVSRSAAITLSLALVDAAIRDEMIDPAELLELVGSSVSR
jgi:hypothetical protein